MYRDDGQRCGSPGWLGKNFVAAGAIYLGDKELSNSGPDSMEILKISTTAGGKKHH